MLIVFMGPPGAGKGTQASALAAESGLIHLATGDMLRSEVAQGTELGKLAQSYMDRGDLVPDEVMVGMIRSRLDSGDRGLLLDGFPRTVAQAEALDGALAEIGQQVDKAIYFNVSEEELVRRLAGRRTCPNDQKTYHVEFSPPERDQVCDDCGTGLIQREDDKPEAVRNRLKVYAEQTSPVLEYYRGQSKLREINGEQPVEDVRKDLGAVVA